jgi:hypothetical protein
MTKDKEWPLFARATEPKERLMSKIENGKLALLKYLDAKSKGEVTPSTRELRDYVLAFANGGVSFTYGKIELTYKTYKMSDVIVTS